MSKKNTALSLPDEGDDEDLEAFMEGLDSMDPDEARAFIKNAVAAMEKEGESIPLPVRLLSSDVLFGMAQTPVGLAFGIGTSDQLIHSGFFSADDIEEFGDPEELLAMIQDDFEETLSYARLVRNDEAIGALLKSAIEGTYQLNEEVFEAMDATELQQSVWKELTKIPYGQTITYEELATRINKPKAVRAVATAVGENPISIVIPCHRIILKSGKIGEYHWGSDIKEKLLAYEKART